MNKIILSLLLISIAFVGIGATAACDLDSLNACENTNSDLADLTQDISENIHFESCDGTNFALMHLFSPKQDDYPSRIENKNG